MRDQALLDGEASVERGEVASALSSRLAGRGIILDAAQQRGVDELQALSEALAEFKRQRQSVLARWLSRPEVPKSLWLYGGVGRGKSMLMDAFYDVVPIRRKTRVHFHVFMRGVHADLRALKGANDPLLEVAKKIAQQYRLICFDEFHIADIADAMILGRLFEALFGHGVVVCTTSNFHPDGLYPNGLQRERVLPAIAMLKAQFRVVEIDGGTDYRLRNLSRARTYIVPHTLDTDSEFDALFNGLATTPDAPKVLTVEGRAIEARRVAGDVAWFGFHALCQTARSQIDYLELAQSFHTILLSDVPQLSVDDSNAARRFTLLVDVLYDHGVKLIVSAAVAPEALYLKGALSHEFPRTVSRLIEMQSQEYIAKAHRAEA